MHASRPSQSHAFPECPGCRRRAAGGDGWPVAKRLLQLGDVCGASRARRVGGGRQGGVAALRTVVWAVGPLTTCVPCGVSGWSWWWLGVRRDDRDGRCGDYWCATTEANRWFDGRLWRCWAELGAVGLRTGVSAAGYGNATGLLHRIGCLREHAFDNGPLVAVAREVAEGTVWHS